MSKRGQITIFIIVSLLVVGIIVLFILFRKDLIPTSTGNAAENPNDYIDSCIKLKLKEAADILIGNGGYIKPDLNIT